MTREVKNPWHSNKRPRQQGVASPAEPPPTLEVPMRARWAEMIMQPFTRQAPRLTVPRCRWAQRAVHVTALLELRRELFGYNLDGKPGRDRGSRHATGASPADSTYLRTAPANSTMEIREGGYGTQKREEARNSPSLACTWLPGQSPRPRYTAAARGLSHQLARLWTCGFSENVQSSRKTCDAARVENEGHSPASTPTRPGTTHAKPNPNPDPDPDPDPKSG
ncbi:hypothetical protein JHW43_001997 [Diplocarpon mali]|nr:hypothetical protein JHW43_001997 [Diplocarpon mali]